MKNIITVGKGSFVGKHFDYPIIEDRLTTDKIQINQILDKYKPSVIINCIAFCGTKNIDDCEKNKGKTLECNLTIPTILATECEARGIKFIHIGSGCIAYGMSNNIEDGVDTGWLETDNPRLENASFYSKVKYSADLAIGHLPNACILRIRMPISPKNEPRNLINKLIGYSDVVEIPNSVTFLSDLKRAVDWAINNNKTGIYNITSSFPLTHSVILEEYKKYVPAHIYNKITVSQLDKITLAKRSNCIIDNSKAQREGFKFAPTYEELKKCMAEFIRNKNGY